MYLDLVACLAMAQTAFYKNGMERFWSKRAIVVNRKSRKT
jgi:hypothetical protein